MSTSTRTFFALCLILATAGHGTAAPPLATDDAGTVEPGRIEIELSSAYSTDRKTAGGVTTRVSTADGELKISTGLCENMGVSVAMPYTFHARIDTNNSVTTIGGIGDLVLEVKYAFGAWGGTKFAIKPQLVVPSGNYDRGFSEGHWHGGATLIASKEFDDGRYLLHINAGYEHHNYRTASVRETTRGSLWSSSIAGELQAAEGLVVVADFGLGTNPDKAGTQLPAYALTGLRYAATDRLEINAGIKFGLTEPENDVTALYGLVLKF